jgi:hypothetical protein
MEASAQQGQATEESRQICAACGYRQQFRSSVCAKCGQVLPQAFRQGIHEVAAPAAVPEEEEPLALGISKFGWLSLAGGLAGALLASSFQFLTYIFSFFDILVHEMGHALTGWFFGYPSIPSFDFYYGGGVTLTQDRIIAINVAVCVLLMLAAIYFRRNSVILIGTAVAAVVYPLLAFSIWSDALIVALGHGTELIIAVIFLYRAMSGSSLIQEAERPVYAFLGFFIVIFNVVFNYKLITNTTFRFEYEYAKGGMQMDYSVLASEYFHTGLVTVAKVFLVLALAAPFISLAIHLVRFQRS